MRRAVQIVFAIIGGVLLLAAGLFGALQTGFGRDRMRLLIADVTAGGAMQVHMDAIEGLVPFDMRLIDVRLSDRDGTWASVDRVGVTWSPLSLLGGRLRIDELTADAVDLARLPATEGTQEPEPSGLLVPELPIAIDLRALSVARLALAAPILGEPATLALRASARLGESGDGLSASLAVRQLSGHTGTATIDFAYTPDQEFLSVSGMANEPRGGVLGRLLGLPQGSDLRIAIEGDGPLKAWHGGMTASLDGEALLDLTADIGGTDARAITFALRSAPDDLLPAQIRPLVAGGLDAKGVFEIEPGGGTVAVSEFSASAAAGRINASGILGLEQQPGDLAVTIALEDSAPFATLVPDVTWSGATVRARLQGTIDRPDATADLAMQNLAAADMRVGTLHLALDASAEQGLEQPVDIRAELRASDFAAADQRLATLLADGARASLTGSADRAGTLVADSVEMRVGTLALTGKARAEEWGEAARVAEATLRISDLAAIAAPLGFAGAGSAAIAMKLEPAVRGDRLEVNATTQALSTGQPILNRLLGQSPRLHLALTGNLPQEMTIATAQLIGAKTRLDARGSVEDRNLELTFTGSLDDATAIDPALRGQIMLDGTIHGPMEAPQLAADLKSSALTVSGRRLEQVTLSAAAADLLSNPKIELEGSATLERLPAKVATHVAFEGERISAPNLVLTLGKSRVTGEVVMASGLLTGEADLDSPDLRELAPLTGIAMTGELSATLRLDGRAGRQDALLSATGRRISAADRLSAAGLEATATVDDLFGAPVLAADLALAQPTIADHPLTRLSVTAKGPLVALQTKASLAGADLEAVVEAEVAQIADGYRIGVQRLTAEVREIAVRSEGSSVIEVGANVIRIDDVALAVEEGSLRLEGSVAADDMELSAAIRSLPLSIIRAFAPDLPITGRLDGELQVTGTPGAPSGHFSIAGEDIGASDVPEQQANLRVAGTLQQGRLELNGEVTPRSGGALTFSAALPSLTSDARLQADADGTFDLLLVDAFLAGGADRIRGKAELDMSALGRLSAPELQGRLRLVDAAYENLRHGIKLRRIEADIRADGPALRVASLSATTPGGGQISGEGQVNLARGVETALSIRARNATVMNTDLATATIDGDLAITGNLDSRLELGGHVKVVKADIRVPDRLPRSVQEIEVIEINAPPQLAARIAAREPPPRQTVIIDLDLSVDAPQQVAVRGRGLDVELGGALHIGGTTARPEIEGALTLRRGSLDIAGRRLDFTEGQLIFEGGDQIDPMLDLTAVTRAQDLEVTAKVEGPARAPRITLTSVPTMPEDEILARLLFGKSAGALSAFELLQLAQATADLAGVNTGPGVLEGVRKRTGLDRLSLEQAEGAAGPSLSAGRYVADGVYVGLSQGATSGSSTATVEIEVTPNVKVETEIGANAAGKAGVYLEWDY